MYSIAAAEKGKTHTIMTCGSASGNVLPPMIIFPRERLSSKQVHGCVPGTLLRVHQMVGSTKCYMRNGSIFL